MKKQAIKSTSSTQNGSSNFLDNFRNEIENFGPESLELVIKKLNYLCLEFDPYQTDELQTTVENILEEFSLTEYISNPFEFTNIVLQLLDITEEKIKNNCPKVH